MARSSKSPRSVLQVAYLIGQKALAPYSHRYSPKKFTQPQLFACLVLKEFCRRDYRGIVAMLQDLPDLCQSIELGLVPHFTTLQKSAQRLLRNRPVRHLLAATLRQARRAKISRRRLRLAALDGTGFESRHISTHFLRRRAQTQQKRQKKHTRHPKVGLLCDCASHLVVAAIPGRGPGSDSVHYRQALKQALRCVSIDILVADASYDSEDAHVYARRDLHIRSIIPSTIGRRTEKPPTGYYRRLMRRSFDKKKYGQRWQVETVISMIKRNLGSALRARKYRTQGREIILRVLAHNIMILRWVRVFYRANPIQFPTPGDSPWHPCTN
jgi:transposase